MHGQTHAARVVTETLGSLVADLERVWPTLRDDVVLVLEEDRHGICHELRRETRCGAPARVVERRLGAILTGEHCCTACIPPALGPGGGLLRDIGAHTLCLRVALDERVAPAERASAAVMTIWNGPSRYLPRVVFERMRGSVLLPLLATLAADLPGRGENETGPLVAFTAGDIRFGMTENPELYRLAARGAVASLVHASPRDGVWLLHDPYKDLAQLPRPLLGIVLQHSVRKRDIDQVACEIFGVLADDALSGLSRWDDIHQWWFAANHLN